MLGWFPLDLRERIHRTEHRLMRASTLRALWILTDTDAQTRPYIIVLLLPASQWAAITLAKRLLRPLLRI